jgi:hypothetical protein
MDSENLTSNLVKNGQRIWINTSQKKKSNEQQIYENAHYYSYDGNANQNLRPQLEWLL